MAPTFRILAGLALLSVPSAADVRLQTPNGGEILRPGSTITIEWMIETQGELDPRGGFAGPSNPNRPVRTNATNWDLFYSTEGPAGAWIIMAKDLAINDMNAGSTHAFDWTVPNTPSMDVWIRVRMDTPGIDYSDSSDDSFEIGVLSSATLRNGSGTNRMCLDNLTLPILGTSWDVDVLTGGHPGATISLIICYMQPADGLFTGAGELLVNLSSPRSLMSAMITTGPIDEHRNPVPLDPSLIGRSAAMQAVILGGAGPELCNAVDTVLGL
jgi:hypothetical protein